MIIKKFKNKSLHIKLEQDDDITNLQEFANSDGLMWADLTVHGFGDDTILYDANREVFHYVMVIHSAGMPEERDSFQVSLDGRTAILPGLKCSDYSREDYPDAPWNTGG